VWAGFVLLVLGTAIAACGKRTARGARDDVQSASSKDAAEDAVGE
jgi:predicted small secreted protein